MSEGNSAYCGLARLAITLRNSKVNIYFGLCMALEGQI